MCQYMFTIVTNAPSAGGVLISGDPVCVLGQGVHGTPLYLPLSFVVNPKLYQKNRVLKTISEIGEYFFTELTRMSRGVIFNDIHGINSQGSSEESGILCGIFYRKSRGLLRCLVPSPYINVCWQCLEATISSLYCCLYFLQNRVFGIMFSLKFMDILPCLTESVGQRHFLSRSIF